MIIFKSTENWEKSLSNASWPMLVFYCFFFPSVTFPMVETGCWLQVPTDLSTVAPELKHQFLMLGMMMMTTTILMKMMMTTDTLCLQTIFCKNSASFRNKLFQGEVSQITLPHPSRRILVSSSKFRNCTSDKQTRIVLCRIFLNVVWTCVFDTSVLMQSLYLLLFQGVLVCWLFFVCFGFAFLFFT